jgi:transposase
MSSRYSCRHSALATSSLSTLSAVTKARPCRVIRAAGAKLFFLPPYSPDLNPIEQVFAKLKTLLRKAAERTVEATWQRIGALLQCFTPVECANYIRNAGYASA